MDDIVTSTRQQFKKIVDIVRADLATIRTGKASPALIENLLCDVYATRMKLVELATTSAFDTTTLIVTPFDAVNTTSIAQSIQEANLGLTALVEDTIIRVIVPPLSQERRGEYVRLVKTKVEGGKVMARQARHQAMELVSRSDLDEDSKEVLEKEIQKLTDDTVEELDIKALEKEKELLAL